MKQAKFNGIVARDDLMINYCFSGLFGLYYLYPNPPRLSTMRTKAGYLFMEYVKAKFEKKSLLISEQIQLLLDRGLIINDQNAAVHCLTTIGYYRLSAYFKSFLLPHSNKHQFKKGITFEKIDFFPNPK